MRKMLVMMVLVALGSTGLVGCSSGEKTTKNTQKAADAAPAWTKMKGSVTEKAIRVVGYSSSLDGTKLSDKDSMTRNQSEMSARTMISMLLNQTVKEYRTKTMHVKEVSSKSKFTGAVVISRYQDRALGIYTLLELELTPEQLKAQKIDDLKLFLEVAKKRAANVVRF